MTEPRRIDVTRAHGALLIEHCDIPADMTLCEYRRQRAAEQAPELRRRPSLKGFLRVFDRAA